MKSKILCFALIGFLLPMSMMAQVFDWALGFGGAGDQICRKVAIDAAGNVFTAGNFSGTVDFDPGPGSVSLSTASNAADIFVQKFDQNGQLLWARAIGGINVEDLDDIAVDATGNVVVVGKAGVNADMDPGTAVVTLPGGRAFTAFATTLSPAGNYLSSFGIGDSSTIEINEASFDPSGNLVLVGSLIGTCDFDPGPGVSYVSWPGGGQDVLVVKYAPNGSYLWAKCVGSGAFEEANAVAFDAAGNVYVTGKYTWTVDFDPGPAVFNLTAATVPQCFVFKWTASGTFGWAVTLAGSAQTQGDDIQVDAAGNVDIVGFVRFGSSDLDPGPAVYTVTSAGQADGLVMQLDANGGFLWGNLTGGNSHDYAMAVDVDAAGGVYVMGSFSGNIDLDPSANSYMTNTNSAGAYLQRFNVSGGFDWARRVSERCIPADMALNSSNEQHVVGGFNFAVDFDPGDYVFNLTPISGIDGFVAKYRPCSLGNGYVTANACHVAQMNGILYYASGTYTQNLTTGDGCDSLLYVQVTLSGADTDSSISVSGCDVVIVNAQHITQSGVYPQVTQNSIGCDSNITIYATITHSTDTALFATVCDSYTLNGITYSATSVYHQTFTNSVGCDSNITLNLNVTHYLIDTSVTLSADSLRANATNSSFQWLDCDNGNAPIAGATQPSFHPSVTGNYAVLVTTGVCSDTSSCFAVTVVGRSEEIALEHIDLFPNPNAGQFTLKYAPAIASTLQLTIVNALGQAVYTSACNKNGLMELDLRSLPKGCYMVQFRTPKAMVFRRLVIE